MKIRIVEISSKEDAIEHIKKVGADPKSVKLMAPKALMRSLILRGVDNRAANIIKQNILSLGGEAAVSWQVGNFKRGKSDVFLMATQNQVDRLVKKLFGQPFGLKDWAKIIKEKNSSYGDNKFRIDCRGKQLRINRFPLVMGVLNVTPDSFSDGGMYYNIEKAAEHAQEMVSEGAGIIDIGGESTRPGSKPVSVKDEISRVLPVIKKISKKIKALISVDTYKPEVAEAAIGEGANIINDVTGLRYKNCSMVKIARKYRTPVIIMHMKGMPKNMQKNPKYKDVVCDINEFFSERIEYALDRGVEFNKIIIDPGIGFGKTVKHNLEILKRLREFGVFGRPVLIGTSRKSFLGHILRDISPKDRLSGSISSFVWASLNGANILRVHNVKETVQALNIVKAIQKTQ
ncbi:MAG: dihydropteroate synthase [Endomicrobiales bacterium]|nr:dihydropteroate synthase [Endomicrobiales bacterium]